MSAVQRFPFVTLDVFTRDRYAGNPLAVVRLPREDQAPLSTEQMQQVAREFNLSETVFLHERRTAAADAKGVPEWRIRIFLTKGEVPFAGHPTIGTACHVLSSLAPATAENTTIRGRFLCNAGPIDLSFDRHDSTACASIPHAVHIHTQHPVAAARLVADFSSSQNLPTAAIVAPPALVSPVRGMNFVLARLADEAALGRVTLAPKPAVQLDAEWDVGFVGLYWYVVLEGGSSSSGGDTAAADGGEQQTVWKLRTRMIEGSLLEDPATGSAACALASFLALTAAAEKPSRKFRFEITQGVEMGRRSEIGVAVTLKADGSAVEKVELSGTAVAVMEGTVML